jgi:ribonuclease HI
MNKMKILAVVAYLLFAIAVWTGIGYVAVQCFGDAAAARSRQIMRERWVKMACEEEWKELTTSPIVSVRKWCDTIEFTLENGTVIEVRSVAHHTAGSHLEARRKKE